MTGKKISRRGFLGRTAGATATAMAAFSILPRYGFGAEKTAPSETLNVAAVGAGGQAAHDIDVVSRRARIVALCDVDDKRAGKTYSQFPDATKYKDYRVMLEKERNNIDAVIVATPDHTHAFAAMAAMELGKHVYVEKPMAHSIYEVRRLMEAARKYKVMTQMGNQGHSFFGCRVLKSWIEDGAIGDVTEIHCWTNRPSWPQGVDRPADTPPVPESLDWNLWLGSAPERPYHPAYCPRDWRGWCDFGTGALGDMGCHIFDAPFWSLNLTPPTRIEVETSERHPETYPKSSIIRYEFPKRGKMPPLKLTWYDGGNEIPRPAELEEGRIIGDRDGGSLLVGTKGKITVGTYGAPVRIIPEEKMQAYKRPEVKYPRSPGQQQEWVAACKGGPPANANFDYAGPLAEVVLLGCVALRAGQPIEWDPVNMKVTNLPEAEAFIKPPYREGWTI
ncbi:MAG TPA: Gfo/Idh/MocA family oxidoreductase [Candidatus Bathyarchaeia archaeon]|nr:Gfo/Idh/MocA family oxidoreductase [Candidatus Bathyarchaeia archaeon]